MPHASRPSTSVNDDNIKKVKEIVLENRCVGIREVAEALNISYLLLAKEEFQPDCAKVLAKHETKVIAQSPYSQDLAPCDFFLFPKLKYPLRGTRHE